MKNQKVFYQRHKHWIALLFVVSAALIAEFMSPNKGNQNQPVHQKFNDSNPSYWVYSQSNYSHTFESVEIVLQRVRVDKIVNRSVNNQTEPENWDLLWSFNYPFVNLKINWKAMKFHQKVNHIPGNFHLCSKSDFGTSTNSKYVPKAFLTSKAVEEYSKLNPEKRFVMKIKSNRGVQLQEVSQMNFSKSNSLTDYFAMEFIEDPLLMNDHKFDFAVYVVITSINPLRLYYYNKNIIMRFCPKTYDTSDPTDVDRYVVRNGHIPGSNFPGIKEFHENGFTYKEGFNAFLKRKGADVDEIWLKIEDLIRSIVISKEKYFIEEIQKLGANKVSFFEMFRFDMILDKNFNLFVIEINQSPNIYAGAQFKSNKHIYESLLYNLFNIIGVASNLKRKDFRFSSLDEESMIVDQKSLSVNPEKCLNSNCSTSLDELCFTCLSPTQKFDFSQAHLEQMRSGEMKRLFPPKKEFLKTATDDFYNSLQDQSKLHVKWFTEMCKKNEKFC